MQKILMLMLCFSFQSLFGEVINGPADLTLKSYDTLTINGPAKMRLIKAKSLVVNGSLDFLSLDVAGKAEITGPVRGEKGKFDTLIVTGTFDANHIISNKLSVTGPVFAAYMDITNNTEVVGPLNVKHCKFNNLTVSAERITLDDVIVNNITINKSLNKQVLTLKGTTIVNGDIFFESGYGILEVEDPSVQINGAVNGASRQE